MAEHSIARQLLRFVFEQSNFLLSFALPFGFPLSRPRWSAVIHYNTVFTTPFVGYKMRFSTVFTTAVAGFSVAEAAPQHLASRGHSKKGEPAAVAKKRAAAVKEAFEFAWHGYHK